METSFWEVKEFPGLAQVLRLPTVTIHKALLGNDSETPLLLKAKTVPKELEIFSLPGPRLIRPVDPGRIPEGQAQHLCILKTQQLIHL